MRRAIGGGAAKDTKKDSKDDEDAIKTWSYDSIIKEDMYGAPFLPHLAEQPNLYPRDKNPVVFFEIHSSGGRVLRDRSKTKPENLGRLYFELRKDLVPIACNNFLELVTGARQYGKDAIKYHYKGIRIHRIVKNLYFQSGDLLDSKGNCSKAALGGEGGVFRDENFLLQHTGAGCISMCNRGFDTNGSIFQVTFARVRDLDGKYVCFGCLASQESYDCLGRINDFGTAHGEPLEELRLVDCGIAYPYNGIGA
jgi:cyclophilin family peptidyl-prolyl cis-trans isomerase